MVGTISDGMRGTSIGLTFLLRITSFVTSPVVSSSSSKVFRNALGIFLAPEAVLHCCMMPTDLSPPNSTATDPSQKFL